MKRALSIGKGCIFISLHVTASSKKTEIQGLFADSLKLKIKSPAKEGEANREIISFFSSLFNVPKEVLEIVKGGKSRNKKIVLPEIYMEKVVKILDDYTK